MISRSAYFIVLIFLIASSYLYGQGEFLVDSTELEIRNFDTEKVEHFLNQRAFNYENDPEYESNIFKKFWFWITKSIREYFRRAGDGSLINIIYYILAGIGISLLIYFIIKGQRSPVFKRGDSSPNYIGNLIQGETGTEDLESIIATHEKAGDYSEAVRYRYIQVLRNLDQNSIIKWKDSKTNAQYEREIKDPDIVNSFSNMTHFFEDVVYGNFTIGVDKYTGFKNQGVELERLIQQHINKIA